MNRIGVIILNYFSYQETCELYRQIDILGNVDVLVVDNSADAEETESLRETIPGERLLSTGKNLGYAGGNNLGIRAMLTQWNSELSSDSSYSNQIKVVSGLNPEFNKESEEIGSKVKLEAAPGVDLIALINPDVRIKGNPFTTLAHSFHKNPRLAAVAPRLCVRDDPERIYSDGGVLLDQNGYFKPAHLNSGVIIDERRSGKADGGESEEQARTWRAISPDRKPDYINGSFFVMNTAAIEEVGLLDENFFLYFEEVDWCRRAVEKSWSIMSVPEVTAWQTISPKNERYNYHFFRSWLLFQHKYNREGVKPLLIDQLKKIKWIISDRNKPLGQRFRYAWYRLKGVTKGWLRL